MGFGNTERKNFVSIVDGKFWMNATEADSGKPNFERRVRGPRSPKAGEEVIGLTYNQYDGLLTGIAITDGTYGREMHLEFDHENMVQISLKSGFAETFMKALPNVELDKTLYLKTYKFQPKDKDKPSIGWTISQRGKKLEPAALARDKNGQPIPLKDKDGKEIPGWESLPIMPDKELIDIGEPKPVLSAKLRIEWLVSHFVEPTIRHLDMLKASRIGEANSVHSAPDSSPADPFPDMDDNEDIPF